MPAAKIYTKEDILRSMKYSRSVKAAARYLGCSYIHVKAYFKMFKVDEMDPNSPTLFDIHLNRSAKGIPKKLKNNKKEPIVKQIFLEGTGYEIQNDNYEHDKSYKKKWKARTSSFR